MRTWLLAWDNLRFNFTKTILSIVLIALATSSILIFRGYVNFTAEGLRMGFIATSGAMQISHRSYWADDSETPPILKTEDKEIIQKALNQISGIDSITELLAFNGIVGTAYRSTFFSGTSYESYPTGLYQKIVKDTPGPLDENGIVLGTGIINYLQINELDPVTILGNGGDMGIALSSMEVVGSIDIGDRNINKVIAFANIQKSREFYGYTDEFDRIRVDVSSIDDIPNIYTQLNELLKDTPYEVKDWLYLNPYFTDIEIFNSNSAFWITAILILLIVTSIVQMLQMSYLQRMRELGTLQGLGLTPKSVFSLLLKETLLISSVSVVLGIAFAFLTKFSIQLLGATFSPPMSTETFPLVLVYYVSDIIIISLGIMGISMISSLYPTYKAVSKPVVEVMKYA